MDINMEFSIKKLRNKKCSTSLSIKEMQTKTTLRFILTSVRMTKINNTSDSSCRQRCGVRRTHSFITGGSVNMYSHYGNQYDFPQKMGPDLPQDSAV